MTTRLRVGLTGGVGSGKSTVAAWLAELGAGIVDTDAIAHALTAPGGVALPAIAQRFGAGVLDGNGALDRAALRALVFSDASARHGLQAILHPLIREEAIRLCESVPGLYVVLVVPLLVENLAAYRPLLDRVLVVDCPEAWQIARTAARPGLDEAQARAILAAQASRSERLAVADDVIDNQGDLADLRGKVEILHARYLALSDADMGTIYDDALRRDGAILQNRRPFKPLR